MRAIQLAGGTSAAEFRAAAATSKDANQARRLLAFAAIRDGLNRTEAARIGGMELQTLRDWVQAFNAEGPGGLINGRSPGRPMKLSEEQQAVIKALVKAGPDPAVDGVVRWRCADLARIAGDRFGVTVDEDTMGRLLHRQGFSHMSARPQHPDQKASLIEDFKKTSRTRSTKP